MKSNRQTLTLLIALALLLFGGLSFKKVGSLIQRIASIPLSLLYDSSLSEKDLEKEKALIQLELLRQRNERLEEFVREEIAYLTQIRKGKEESLHERQLKELLEEKEEGLLAFINWRSPVAWNSLFWVDKGSEEGVEKGAVALSGNSLVGVVDEVEPHRSRILLLTDPSLKISVRALRKEGGKERFLAKGELIGARSPYFRQNASLLKGEGFNYQWSDAFGEGTSLRGKEHIIDVGDTLITSGLDGLFPAGIIVGSVTAVAPLKEGEFSYSIEAKPATSETKNLTAVWLLKPIRK